MVSFSPFDSIDKVVSPAFPDTSLKKLQIVYKLAEEDGCTLPFIARYRQELTGGMGPDELRPILHSFRQLCKLCERKDTVYDHISKALQEGTPKLTKTQLNSKLKSIENSLLKATTINSVDAIYQPFKPSAVTTLADRAREHGLDNVADAIWKGEITHMRKFNDALKPIVHKNSAKNSNKLTFDSAKQGVGHLLAERISQDSGLRLKLRDHVMRYGNLQCSFVKSRSTKTTAKAPKKKAAGKGKQPTKETFGFYEKYDKPLRYVQSHNIMAIKRGETLKLLKSKIAFLSSRDSEMVVKMCRRAIPHTSRQHDLNIFLDDVSNDAWKRLLFPSISRTVFHDLLDKAHKDSAEVFSRNLEGLLLGEVHLNTPVLGLDPGYAHGCKLAAIGPQGDVLETCVVFPHSSGGKGRGEAAATLRRVVAEHSIRHVAVGNGTASKESVQFCRSTLQDCRVQVHTVSEAGASVYSASKVAKSEFPDKNVELLGAVSIGRRWQNPLSELVKVEPQSLGVGMYQHDLPTKVLDEHLTDTVVDCVSRVGADVNMASVHLLQRISGLTKALASKVHSESRKKAFTSRDEIRARVKGLGPKRFEQCAGFLTVSNASASNLLDCTCIHPESYGSAESLWKAARKATRKAGEKDKSNRFRVSKVGLQVLESLRLGEPTKANEQGVVDRDLIQIANFLADAVREDLGMDSRQSEEAKTNKRSIGLTGEQEEENVESISKVEDLKPGMRVKGVVSNVAPFGAFIDLGVSKSGLLHCSKWKCAPIVGQTLVVVVESVDLKRGRISLADVDAPSKSVSERKMKKYKTGTK